MKPNRVMPLIAVVASSLLWGCAAKQDITRLEASPQRVCILRHEAVQSGVLDAIRQGFERHNIQSAVVTGVYEEKHGIWNPKWYPDQVTAAACDALCSYVANWSWDVATYMHFANIKTTTADGNRVLSQATYTAGAGPSKWINAADKIRELMDQMLAGHVGGGYAPTPVAGPLSAPAAMDTGAQTASASPPTMRPEKVLVAGIPTGADGTAVMAAVRQAFLAREWTILASGADFVSAHLSRSFYDSTLTIVRAGDALIYTDNTIKEAPAGAGNRTKLASTVPERWLGYLRSDIAKGIEAASSVAPQPVPIPSTAADPSERMRKLKEMLDAGLITQTQFEKKRAEILSDL